MNSGVLCFLPRPPAPRSLRMLEYLVLYIALRVSAGAWSSDAFLLFDKCYDVFRGWMVDVPAIFCGE